MPRSRRSAGAAEAWDVTGAPASVGVIVPAAGRGERLRGELPKSLAPLDGRPLVQYALETLAGVDEVATIDGGRARGPSGVGARAHRARLGKIAAVVPGGADRQASVALGLAALPR